MLHAFIDEAGDEGMGSHCDPWLVMSALIVLEAEVVAIKQTVVDGIAKIWTPGQSPANASFKDTAHPRRVALSQLLRRINGDYIVIAINKKSLTPAQCKNLKCPKMYHFLAKHMVERLSWYAKDRGVKVNITFGARKQIKFKALETYLTATLKNQRTKSHYIEYANLGALRESPTASNVLLQAADWIASGLAQGLNKDRHGNTEDRFTKVMWGKFWLRSGKLWHRGITVLPSNFDRKEEELFRKIDTWLEDPTTLL